MVISVDIRANNWSASGQAQLELREAEPSWDQNNNSSDTFTNWAGEQRGNKWFNAIGGQDLHGKDHGLDYGIVVVDTNQDISNKDITLRHPNDPF